MPLTRTVVLNAACFPSPSLSVHGLTTSPSYQKGNACLLVLVVPLQFHCSVVWISDHCPTCREPRPPFLSCTAHIGASCLLSAIQLHDDHCSLLDESRMHPNKASDLRLRCLCRSPARIYSQSPDLLRAAVGPIALPCMLREWRHLRHHLCPSNDRVLHEPRSSAPWKRQTGSLQNMTRIN